MSSHISLMCPLAIERKAGILIVTGNDDSGCAATPELLTKLLEWAGPPDASAVSELCNLTEQAGCDGGKALEVMRERVLDGHFKEWHSLVERQHQGSVILGANDLGLRSQRTPA